MTVPLVIGGLLALLALWCWVESRRGRPAWGAHLRSGRPEAPVADGARGTVVTSLALGAAMGLDGGGDG